MSKIQLKSYSLTPPQLKYIEQLCIDLYFTRVQRNAHLSALLDRKIQFLDELTKLEATRVIAQFKEWKDGGMPNGTRAE